MIVLETKKSNKNALLSLQRKIPNQCEVLDCNSSEAQEVVQVLVEITKITAPYVAGLLTAKLNNEMIRVKKNGIEITARLNKKGLNKAKMAMELLLIDSENDIKDENENQEE